MPTADQYNQWAIECETIAKNMRKVADPVIDAFTPKVMAGPKANSIKAKIVEGDKDFALVGAQAIAMGVECKTRAGICVAFQGVWDAWRARQHAHVAATNSYNAGVSSYNTQKAAYDGQMASYTAAMDGWNKAPAPKPAQPVAPAPFTASPPAAPTALDPEPQPPATWVEIKKH
jgi:hypothetical protein